MTHLGGKITLYGVTFIKHYSSKSTNPEPKAFAQYTQLRSITLSETFRHMPRQGDPVWQIQTWVTDIKSCATLSLPLSQNHFLLKKTIWYVDWKWMNNGATFFSDDLVYECVISGCENKIWLNSDENKALKIFHNIPEVILLYIFKGGFGSLPKSSCNAWV